MGMNLTTYVGPFAMAEGKTWEDFEEFEHLVIDGRMEAATEGEPLILVPNVEMETLTRDPVIDSTGSQDFAIISPERMFSECQEFLKLIEPVIKKHNLPVYWGVVPCWS